MANHVFNEVYFHGSDSDLMVAEYYFEKMEACQPKTEESQRPHFFIEMPKRFFGDIEAALLPGVLRVEYRTDCCPNLEDLVTIGEYFGLDFESFYVEHEKGYYGACRFRYDDGKFFHTWLEESDFIQIEYDKNNGYLYKDHIFKFKLNCYSHVLKEKLDGLEQSAGLSRGR